MHSVAPPQNLLSPAESCQRLLGWMEALPSAVVAFSGGVDSSVVAYVAHQVLGKKMLALTSASPSLNRADLSLTETLAQSWGMSHRVIHTTELEDPAYRRNPVNRCYYCKTNLYQSLAQIAQSEGYAALLNGTNQDDLGDHRPGLKAATEHRVQSPLAALGFDKATIRAVAHHLGLENAEKPQAACLSSRVPHGLGITEAMLAQIEQAEAFLKGLGFEQVRVRHHAEMARIEVPPSALTALVSQAQPITAALKKLGYRYVSLDLEGFRSGSLNPKPPSVSPKP